MKSYKDIYYRQVNMPLDDALELLDTGTNYIIVWNNEFTTYFGFTAAYDIGTAVDYDNNFVVKTHIDWWNKHPDTFPQWQTKEGE